MLFRTGGAPANDGALVSESERRLAITEAGSDDPCHLRRHVWAEHGDLARFRLDEAEDIVPRGTPEATLEHARKLEGRRRDESVSVDGKSFEHPSRELAATRCLFGQ